MHALLPYNAHRIYVGAGKPTESRPPRTYTCSIKAIYVNTDNKPKRGMEEWGHNTKSSVPSGVHGSHQHGRPSRSWYAIQDPPACTIPGACIMILFEASHVRAGSMWRCWWCADSGRAAGGDRT